MKEELTRIEKKVDKLDTKLDYILERSVRNQEKIAANSGSIKIIGSALITAVIGVVTYLFRIFIDNN